MVELSELCLRNCILLCALNTACHLLIVFPDVNSDNITKEFAEYCEHILDRPKPSWFIIDEETTTHKPNLARVLSKTWQVVRTCK